MRRARVAEADAEELSKLRALLCIPKADRDAMHRELCGSLYRTAVEAALNQGIDGFGLDDKKAVAAARDDLKLDRDLAKDVLSTTARK